jgi:putative hydrolase of the HAD superfamily
VSDRSELPIPSSANGLRAVTFDFWNTIVRANAEQGALRVHAWRAELAASGHEVSEDALRTAFATVWSQHETAWYANEQFTGHRAGETALDLLGLSLDSATRRRLVELFVTAGEAADFELCPGVDGALRELSERGIRVGIVCDVGFTPSPALRRILQRFGLLDCFAGWSFSDEVGWYKPASEIFEHALAYLGATPEETAHVGDLRRTDVAGARAMGMTAVRYRGAYDDLSEGPEGDLVVDDHAALSRALAE